ncbi:FMN-binding negative transcriptional regulator [Luteolibacter flavescens]|uniref:FMN-binding negative transcriptional regulator n=1 Tax=Luteolibacter flavescens TaxID=1859460 RepID=A0ABT3FVQ9_9BACT|nr:FMN-binding negative transcriptional regulator [Luteolibacter flavescens]MCW1887414.1 FMN-binding negative transcriptional regulator [Luteolibacter flavescens]
MYIPPHFEESRPEEIERIIREHPLGTVTYHTPSGPDAVHIPFVLRRSGDGNGTLHSHVARKNPIWQQVAEGGEVLVIFHGTQAYISPNWYPSKHETHRMVPTWNYQVVHVRGTIRFITDPKSLRASVALLTHANETRVQEEKPWSLGDAEPGYVAGLLEEIVGVEITISGMTGISKLSQNRDRRDKDGVVNSLCQRGESAMADAIEKAWPGDKD